LCVVKVRRSYTISRTSAERSRKRKRIDMLIVQV
jgi:hypothetical protein